MNIPSCQCGETDPAKFHKPRADSGRYRGQCIKCFNIARQGRNQRAKVKRLMQKLAELPPEPQLRSSVQSGEPSGLQQPSCKAYAPLVYEPYDSSHLYRDPRHVSWGQFNRDFIRWKAAKNASPAVKAQLSREQNAAKRKNAPAGYRWCGYGQHYVKKDEWGGHPSYCKPCATDYHKEFRKK